MKKLRYDINDILTYQKRCNNCLEDFENGDEIIRYDEIVKDFDEYDIDSFDEREYFFCCPECMMNHIINGDNVRYFKIELYDSKDSENIKVMNDIENEIRNIKCGETKVIHDLEIFTFEKNGYINYLLNNNFYGNDLDGVIEQVIRLLRYKGVVK